MASVWTDTHTERLIHFVQKRPVLYNTKLKEYKDNCAKDNAYQEIANKLGQDVDEVKRMWDSIRKKYVRERNALKDELKSGAACSEKHSKWPHYKSMQFIGTFIKTRIRSTNLKKKTTVKQAEKSSRKEGSTEEISTEEGFREECTKNNKSDSDTSEIVMTRTDPPHFLQRVDRTMATSLTIEEDSDEVLNKLDEHESNAENQLPVGLNDPQTKDHVECSSQQSTSSDNEASLRSLSDLSGEDSSMEGEKRPVVKRPKVTVKKRPLAVQPTNLTSEAVKTGCRKVQETNQYGANYASKKKSSKPAKKQGDEFVHGMVAVLEKLADCHASEKPHEKPEENEWVAYCA